MHAETVLALMLSIGPAPGRSQYSIVEVPTNQTAAPCADAVVTCKAPWRDELGRWVRYEQPDEGLERYWQIAKSIALHAADDDSARIMIAITKHESHWRRDIHSGRNHTDRNSYPVGSWRRELEDYGHSFCLGQFKVGRGTKRGAALIGLDDASTDRCIGKLGSEVKRIRRYCRTVGPRGAACVFTTYGGGGVPATDKRIKARMRTVGKLRGLSPVLAADVRKRLKLKPKPKQDANT